MGRFDALPDFPFTNCETKRVISNKQGVYELPLELPNDLEFENQSLSQIFFERL